jgi:polyisoprenoid-binding protein YceI
MFFKMRSAYSVAAISAVLTVAAVASAAYKAENPSVVVHAKGPLGLNIDGKSSKLVVEESEKNVSFKTFLNTIDTGNGMRNTHMQKRLGHGFNADGKEVEMFGITLSVPKDKVESKKSGTVTGTLNFHGVSKPVKVDYSVDGSKHVSAKFEFNIFDHFPVTPKFTADDKEKLLCNTGVCAKPEVKVEVSFDLKE